MRYLSIWRRFKRAPIEFRWKMEGESWILMPAREDGWRITVEKPDADFWTILIGGRALPGRYTSVQGAKVDAWQFAISKAVFLFGTRRICLK